MTYTPKFEKALAVVFNNEGNGKFTNDPLDKGGATRWGITQLSLQVFRGQPVSELDVKNLSREEAAEIYFLRYWKTLNCEEITSGPIATSLFDMSVLVGVRQAAGCMQMACNLLPTDGIIGPKSIAKINGEPLQGLMRNFDIAVSDFLCSIVMKKQEQSRFLYGWLCRLARLRCLALTNP